jgi:DNA-binding transcriptional regulator YdaS (Cro superfamily)
MTPQESFTAAVEMFGSEAALAREARCSQANIWRARKLNRPSAEMSKRIELATRGKITRAMLRPDLFLKQGISFNKTGGTVRIARGHRNSRRG